LAERQSNVGLGLQESQSIGRFLLNPIRENDGCWNRLILIAGGTGITPMIQLIQHHIRHQHRLDPKFSMHLLFLNHTFLDIVAGPYLDSLVAMSKDKLKITYGLSRPPLEIDKLAKQTQNHQNQINIGAQNSDHRSSAL